MERTYTLTVTVEIENEANTSIHDSVVQQKLMERLDDFDYYTRHGRFYLTDANIKSNFVETEPVDPAAALIAGLFGLGVAGAAKGMDKYQSHKERQHRTNRR